MIADWDASVPARLTAIGEIAGAYRRLGMPWLTEKGEDGKTKMSFCVDPSLVFNGNTLRDTDPVIRRLNDVLFETNDMDHVSQLYARVCELIEERTRMLEEADVARACGAESCTLRLDAGEGDDPIVAYVTLWFP